MVARVFQSENYIATEHESKKRIMWSTRDFASAVNAMQSESSMNPAYWAVPQSSGLWVFLFVVSTGSMVSWVKSLV